MYRHRNVQAASKPFSHTCSATLCSPSQYEFYSVGYFTECTIFHEAITHSVRRPGYECYVKGVPIRPPVASPNPRPPPSPPNLLWIPTAWAVAHVDVFPPDERHWRGTMLQSSACGAYGDLLGGYRFFGSGAWLARTYDSLPKHNRLRVSFDFVKIDAWDNDLAVAKVDGTTVWSHRFKSPDTKLICGDPLFKDDVQTVDIAFLHSQPTATLSIHTTLKLGAEKQSWGIQN
eukprot:6191278-Pleurochrysis_carterae.AAC.1